MSDPLARARAQFAPNPDWAYLDTATVGLPPRLAIEQLGRAEREWQRGDADWPAWEGIVEPVRSDFGALIGAPADEIALLPSISIGVGFVATSLPAGAEVVVPADEYSSVILPMLVAAERRGVVVREVPFDGLVEAVGSATHLVAVSSVQMHTGRAPDLPALAARCRDVGARLLLDASQGLPLQDLRPLIADVDVVVAAAYKHLLAPHGSAFLRVRRDRWDELAPDAANGRSNVAGTPYLGGPLRLRPDASRFDTALASLPWIATAASIRLVREWRDAGLFAEVRRLTDRLAAGLGLPSPAASLVCLPVPDDRADAALAALAAARVRGALRYGFLRLAPHLWTTDGDVDRAVAALVPFAGD
jgi:selenocysteine lyase/cysteine desulfurase